MDLYKQPRAVKQYRRVKAYSKNFFWHVDLTDYSKIPGSQKGFILNCIDVLTRRAWTKVITHKTSHEITEAFKSFKVLPKNIYVDGESGIRNNSYLLQNDVNIIITTPPRHAVLAELFIKYQKAFLQKKIDATGRWKEYVEIYTKQYNDHIIERYQHSPNEMYEDPFLALEVQLDEDDEEKQREDDKRRITPLKINSYVLTKKLRDNLNHKGYKQQWNKTPMMITGITNSIPTMYKLDDNKTYYRAELQPISLSEAQELNKKPVKAKSDTIPKQPVVQTSITDNIKNRRKTAK